MQVEIGLPKEMVEAFRKRGYEATRLGAGHLVKGNMSILFIYKSNFMEHIFSKGEDKLLDKEHLFDMVDKMVEAFPYCQAIIIDDGQIPDRHRSIYLGALASCYSRGCPTETLPLEEAIIYADKVLNKNNDEKGRGVVHPQSHKINKIIGLDERLLDVMPNIGLTRAKALLDAFGSIEKVLQASRKELEAVDGIGPAIAMKIYKSIEREQLKEWY